VAKVTAHQFAESAQLAFRLRSDIIGHEVFQSPDPTKIVITLRTPFNKSADRIRALRERWQLDAVVLDAGHGGKDGGTVGKREHVRKILYWISPRDWGSFWKRKPILM